VKLRQKAVIRVEAVPEEEFEGEVKEVSQTAKESNLPGTGLPRGERTFQIRVEIKNTKKAPPRPASGQPVAGSGGLRPGMTATVKIIIERLTDVVSVPLECVFDRGKDKIAYLQRAGQFRPVEIEVGPQNQDMVVIKRGLGARDRIALRDIGEPGRRASTGTRMGGAGLPL